METLSLKLQVESLLISCAILPMLKGFYPLRDLVLLYHKGDTSPRKAAAYLTPLYGKSYRGSIRRALHHSWRRPECRLAEYMGQNHLDAPPGIEEFALALCRRLP